MIKDIEKAFKLAEDDFLEFEKVENPPSGRPDLCAFLLLDRLVPGDRDVISDAEHDHVWLGGIDAKKFKKAATQEDVVYLRRCGVGWDREAGMLCMFT